MKTERSHWNNLRKECLHWEFSDAFNLRQFFKIVPHSVNLVVCIWRLLVVSIDGLGFICKVVYVPLSNFRLMFCGYCWDLIKMHIFLRFSAYKCVCVCGLGVRSGPEGMRVCARVLAFTMHSFSMHNPHGPKALYELLNASFCARNRSLLSHLGS